MEHVNTSGIVDPICVKYTVYQGVIRIMHLTDIFRNQGTRNYKQKL